MALVVVLSAGAGCATSRAARVDAPSAGEVLAEISRRTALPEADLKERLSQCDANQQNMYFCAFRDFIAADLQLEHTAAEQARRYPHCKEQIGRHLRTLRQRRDSKCGESAAQEFGDGSMRPTAQAICASGATKPLIDQVAALQGCP